MVSIDAVLDLLDVVDLDRYPLNDPDSVAYADLVERCRAQLAETGASELEDFLNGPGLDLMLADAIELEPQAFRSGGLGTAYLGPPTRPCPRTIPAATGATTELARWPTTCSRPTRRSAGCTSLPLRDADVDGDFEVVPRVRSADDERYDNVARVLAGDTTDVVMLPMSPGTLLIFEGRHSIHRVTPIAGATTRLVGLFGYDTQPGTMSSELLKLVRYGRSEPVATS